MATLKSVVDSLRNENDNSKLANTPSQLKPSEKILEKFPPKAPLEDPPRKGKTAKKNKEVPSLRDINEEAVGLLISTSRVTSAKFYRESDGKVFTSSRYDPEQPGEIVFVRYRDENGNHNRKYEYQFADGRESINLGKSVDIINAYAQSNNFNRVIVGSVFDSLERETFRVDFTRTDVVFNNKTNALAYSTQLRAVWNAASSNFQLFKNNREVEMSKDIFHGVEKLDDVMKKVFHPDKYEVYRLAYHTLGALGNELKPNLARALKRLRMARIVETLHSAGLDISLVGDALRYMVSRFEVRQYEDGKQIVTLRVTNNDLINLGRDVDNRHRRVYYNGIPVNPVGTKPADILMLPKWLLKDEEVVNEVLRGSSWLSVIKLLQQKVYRGENTDIIREVITSVIQHDTDETRRRYGYKADLVMEILNGIEEGYIKDYKRLIEYLTFDVKFSQGITSPGEAWNILKDYYRMCRQMEIEPIKFPPSLKLAHDVAVFNHSKMTETINNKEFEKVMNKFKEKIDLTHSEKFKRNGEEVTWEIVIPDSPKALVQEGNNLNHCVGSYVDNVVEGRTTILFLREFVGERDTSVDGKSLLTIEVLPHYEGDKLVYYINQARGNSNRIPKEAEEAFMKKWISKRPLFRHRHEAIDALKTKVPAKNRWLQAV